MSVVGQKRKSRPTILMSVMRPKAEVATADTGKTRTVAAFIKRLFEAGLVARVLFLVSPCPQANWWLKSSRDENRDETTAEIAQMPVVQDAVQGRSERATSNLLQSLLPATHL